MGHNPYIQDLTRDVMSTDVLPEFGEGVPHRETPCSPRELFYRLLDAERSVEFFEPAFRFAQAALTHPELGPVPRADLPIDAWMDELTRPAASTLAQIEPSGFSEAWPVSLAREFGPVGLNDGVWLQGAVRMNRVEDRTGMALLKQLMIRFGDPGTSESQAQRYASLLRSLGVSPNQVLRWDPRDPGGCAEISFEHGLLGMSLSLFPSALHFETVGFNLWMATLGPCPLLEKVLEPLRHSKAALGYFESIDRPEMARLGRLAVSECLATQDDARSRERIARGFLASHRAYSRWQTAMLGRNVPFSPRDFVVEMVRRKAPFALGHHGGTRIDGRKIEDYLAGGPEDHARLVDILAQSQWIVPGSPQTSPFMQLLRFGGPMFDIFTAAEQRTLHEWISGRPTVPAAHSPQTGLPLEGCYTAPQELGPLTDFAVDRFGALDMPELLFHLVNADLFPPVRIVARELATSAFQGIDEGFREDGRLNPRSPPPYSESVLSEMLTKFHADNVSSRRLPPKKVADEDLIRSNMSSDRPNIVALLDGVWLQGFADVQRVSLEEYGYLFRTYASELGDGELDWNHNHLIRKHLTQIGNPHAGIPLTDPLMYQHFNCPPAALLMVALSLHTRHFLAELLGMNAVVEATGVGGYYLTAVKRREKKGEEWWALSARLHNSIDNFATGHTRWAADAVHAYLARVRDAAPDAQAEHWRRVWQQWRMLEIRHHGSEEEINALNEFDP
jgi:hypothetical protein